MCTYTALSVTLSRTAKSIVESQVHFPESIFIHITNSYNIYSYCILEILIGFVYIIVFYYGPSSRKYHREGFFFKPLDRYPGVRSIHLSFFKSR